MEGPIEGAASAGTRGVVLQEDVLAPLPGGKALMRLVEMLARDGLGDLAIQTVQDTVGSESAGIVLEAAANMGMTISPNGGPSVGAKPSKTRKAKAKSDDSAAEASASAQQIATAAMEAANAMGQPGPGPQWRSLGPFTVTNGQTYGSSRVNVSGRVSALATDPSTPAHILAGAANGGVWESFNRGASWTARTDYKATTTVGALAFDPNNARTVYCGTGEGDWWSWLGAGILKSLDGGTTWSTLCTNPFMGKGFYVLRVDPADSRRIFAGVTDGLYVSVDSGATWTQRRAQRTWTISLAPGGGELLASCSDGLFRSTNNGTSWAAVALPGAPAPFQRLAVAIAPSNSTIAYAWGANNSGTTFLWRRASGTWTAVASPPGASGGQSWYDWYVAVAPDQSNQVFCGAIDLHRGTLSGSTWTWVNLSSKGAGQDSIHPDQHSIAFEGGNANTVYAGNDGGVFRSADRGITWIHCNNGLVISEYEYIAQDYGSARWLIGGTQDNGTNRWTGPPTWEHVADGDGGDCGTNRLRSNTVYHTFQNGWLERSDSKGSWGSWVGITPTRPAGEGPGLFYVPFECSASNGDTIALGGLALYISRSNGSTWTRLAFPGGGGTASACYLSDADTVLVGLTDGRIFRTRFSGGVWSALTVLTTPRANAWISDLHATAGASGRIWATISTLNGGRVFRSDNGGTNWTNVSAGLPNLPINAVAVDNGNANRVWVAADVGVYQTLNAGAAWADYSNALPNAYVGDLVFHPHARVLRAGTRNRGVWEIPVDGWMTQPICGVQFTGSLTPNQVRRWFTWGWPATWHMVWTVMPTTPLAGAPQVSWTVQVERASSEHVSYWLTVTNLTAQPVSFEGRYCILSRY